MEQNLKKITFTTENGGVKPAVRKAVKEQAIKHAGIDLGDFEKMADGSYGMPVAIDYHTNKTIYLLIDTRVSFAPVKKEKGEKAVKENTTIPNLF